MYHHWVWSCSFGVFCLFVFEDTLCLVDILRTLLSTPRLVGIFFFKSRIGFEFCKMIFGIYWKGYVVFLIILLNQWITLVEFQILNQFLPFKKGLLLFSFFKKKKDYCIMLKIDWKQGELLGHCYSLSGEKVCQFRPVC